jgi:hypothetical protein
MNELNQDTKIDIKTAIVLGAFLVQTAINYAINNSAIEYQEKRIEKLEAKFDKLVDKFEIKIDRIHEEIQKR